MININCVFAIHHVSLSPYLLKIARFNLYNSIAMCVIEDYT